MRQATLFDYYDRPVCCACQSPGPLFEHWYSDTLPEGEYCEECIEGEYDEV